MPKLDTFTLKIKTGERGRTSPLKYTINGFKLEFEPALGNTDPEGEIIVSGDPMSFPHTFLLIGPEDGEEPWDIAGIEALYNCAEEEPYTIHMGAVTLEDDADLNLWHERPTQIFDV